MQFLANLNLWILVGQPMVVVTEHFILTSTVEGRGLAKRQLAQEYPRFGGIKHDGSIAL